MLPTMKLMLINFSRIQHEEQLFLQKQPRNHRQRKSHDINLFFYLHCLLCIGWNMRLLFYYALHMLVIMFSIKGHIMFDMQKRQRKNYSIEIGYVSTKLIVDDAAPISGAWSIFAYLIPITISWMCKIYFKPYIVLSRISLY